MVAGWPKLGVRARHYARLVLIRDFEVGTNTGAHPHTRTPAHTPAHTHRSAHNWWAQFQESKTCTYI